LFCRSLVVPHPETSLLQFPYVPKVIGDTGAEADNEVSGLGDEMIALMRILILLGGTVLALDTCRAHSTFTSVEGDSVVTARAAQAPVLEPVFAERE
jgi:hypothetical protein